MLMRFKLCTISVNYTYIYKTYFYQVTLKLVTFKRKYSVPLLNVMSVKDQQKLMSFAHIKIMLCVKYLRPFK